MIYLFFSNIQSHIQRIAVSLAEHVINDFLPKLHWRNICERIPGKSVSLIYFEIKSINLQGFFPSITAYKCEYCDRAFTQSGDMKKHLRLHVGQFPYQCTECSESFRLQTELRNHSFQHYAESQKNLND